MAHGVKKVRTKDGDVIEIPKVRRTRSRKVVTSAYRALKAEKPYPEPVCGGSMMSMLRALTSGEQKMKSCIDYCLGVLVFENIRTLKGIITAFVPEVSKRKLLLKQAEAVADFLKHGYSHHVDCDTDQAHNS